MNRFVGIPRQTTQRSALLVLCPLERRQDGREASVSAPSKRASSMYRDSGLGRDRTCRAVQHGCIDEMKWLAATAFTGNSTASGLLRVVDIRVHGLKVIVRNKSGAANFQTRAYILWRRVMPKKPDLLDLDRARICNGLADPVHDVRLAGRLCGQYVCPRSLSHRSPPIMIPAFSPCRPLCAFREDARRLARRPQVARRFTLI